MPKCNRELASDHEVVGEICHIRARNQRGPRYDASLTAAQKDDISNLLLLCPTCHSLADKCPDHYPVELLREWKAMQESGGAGEMNPFIATLAMKILHRHQAKKARVSSSVRGGVKSSASGGSVAVSIGGANTAPININVPPSPRSNQKGHRPGSIGADADMANYIDYLCDLYVKYMSSIDKDEGRLRGKIGNHIKSKFRLRSRTRNDLSAGLFKDLVDYIIEKKLKNTPVGRKHTRIGTSICSSFDDYRKGK